MKKFILFTLLLFFGCSKNYEKEIFEADNLIKLGKFKQAIELLKKVANENDEKFSPIALKNLANIYQQHLLKEINYYESQKIAQKYFYKIYEKFPSSSDAPKSLFMSAYLLANEIKDYKQATKHYNLFIEKYPQDELVKDAKIELENMGLPPEEILKKNIVKSDAN
jgi:tetratricopeptide (TPR) repeat protein